MRMVLNVDRLGSGVVGGHFCVSRVVYLCCNRSLHICRRAHDRLQLDRTARF